MLDLGTRFGQRVERRLRSEPILWLVTVRADGTPQPVPIWFIWDGKTIVIYSQPNTPKLRNIARSPNVALHFDGNGDGGDIIVISGEARVDSEIPPIHKNPDYVKKYGDGGYIARLGVNPEGMARRYSVPIRVTPTRVHGH